MQLAWLWKYHQPNSALSKKWADRLKPKGRGRKVAIVALARQLVVAIYQLLVNGVEIDGAVKQKGNVVELPSRAQYDKLQEACN